MLLCSFLHEDRQTVLQLIKYLSLSLTAKLDGIDFSCIDASIVPGNHFRGPKRIKSILSSSSFPTRGVMEEFLSNFAL